ncbi:hypothetical protein MED297_20462 [Reinekea sp. MED297]|uniref:Uncharacterized protein n=1 Tax=Reinekea blandensis MED297 TaxID=314283 RepID=A4B9J7_9GAMM|nr:hypothetical protein MED297_20462 [Reinekea sp. MED297] [Reinekea blandensis MED297]
MHLEKTVAKLLASVIEPEVATMVSACLLEYDFERYKSSKVWAIVRQGDSWLLTIEDKDEFALGFGSSTKTIMMLGFSSADAVGEWCA